MTYAITLAVLFLVTRWLCAFLVGREHERFVRERNVAAWHRGIARGVG